MRRCATDKMQRGAEQVRRPRGCTPSVQGNSFRIFTCIAHPVHVCQNQHACMYKQGCDTQHLLC
jgi:hypothetical protein